MSKTNNKSSVRGPSVGSIKRDFKDVFGFAPDDKNIHKIATRVAAPGPDGSRSADPIYQNMSLNVRSKVYPTLCRYN